MDGKGIFSVVLGLGLVTGIVILVTKKEKAAPPPEIPTAKIPTTQDILASKNFIELDTFYNLINGLFTIGKISRDTYMSLYDAYEARFYQLLGGIASENPE